MRKRREDPEFREKELERGRKYHSNPKVKKHKRDCARKYRQKEGVKERYRAYAKEKRKDPKFREQERRKERIRRREKRYKQRVSERIKNNPVLHFSNKVRSNICMAFKRGGNNKEITSSQILGCSLDQFREHIASQFKPGMTLENHGEWHLDHVIPMARALQSDFFSPEQLCHYTNYQPLWAKENLAKQDK